jgi:hypothetical protein
LSYSSPKLQEGEVGEVGEEELQIARGTIAPRAASKLLSSRSSLVLPRISRVEAEQLTSRPAVSVAPPPLRHRIAEINHR